jgi:hypothetical protein
MKKLFLALLVGVLVSGGYSEVAAKEELTQVEKLAFANFHDEMIQCSAYFSLSAELFRKELTPNKATIKKLVQFRKELSRRIGTIGKLIGMKEEASIAMMRLVFSNMIQTEMNNDSVNFPILIEKYADLCKIVYENSDTRIKYWMNEAAKQP